MKAIFRQTLALALLHDVRIPDGLKLLRSNLSILKRPHLTDSVINKFERIFDHIDSYWLTDWSAKDISFFEDEQRTNNDLQS